MVIFHSVWYVCQITHLFPASTPRELAAPTPVTTPSPAPAVGPKGVTSEASWDSWTMQVFSWGSVMIIDDENMFVRCSDFLIFWFSIQTQMGWIVSTTWKQTKQYKGERAYWTLNYCNLNVWHALASTKKNTPYRFWSRTLINILSNNGIMYVVLLYWAYVCFSSVPEVDPSAFQLVQPLCWVTQVWLILPMIAIGDVVPCVGFRTGHFCWNSPLEINHDKPWYKPVVLYYLWQPNISLFSSSPFPHFDSVKQDAHMFENT